MNLLEQRLQSLEREFLRSRRTNRILVMLVVIVGCIAGAQVATPQTSKRKDPSKFSSQDGGEKPDTPVPVPDPIRTIEAEEFVLRDPTGRPRARIAMANDGPTMSMFDEKGQKRLTLGLSSIASGLHLLDSAELPVVSLQVPHQVGGSQLEIRSPQGSSLLKADGVSVVDAAGQSRLLLSLLNGNYPVLGISQSGQAGPPSIEMVAGEGSRSWKIHDDAGHPLFSVTSDQGDNTTLTMSHPDHDRTLQLSNGPKNVDGPTMTLTAPTNEDGSGGQLPFVKIGLYRDHQPYIRMIDVEGRARFAAPVE